MFNLEVDGLVKGFVPGNNDKTYLKVGTLDANGMQLEPLQRLGNLDVECRSQDVEGLSVGAKVRVFCILQFYVQEWSDPHTRKKKFFDHYKFICNKVQAVK